MSRVAGADERSRTAVPAASVIILLAAGDARKSKIEALGGSIVWVSGHIKSCIA